MLDFLHKMKKLYELILFSSGTSEYVSPIIKNIEKNEKYGEIWRIIYDEYELTTKYVLKLTGHTELMDGYPLDRESVKMRERIVLPITTIQQYGICKANEIRQLNSKSEHLDAYEKLIMRCSFGIINAARNSA